MKNKKGALEMSVNTIVVIVIAVTLLTLGLFFIRGLFTKITDLSGKVFDEGNQEIEKLSRIHNEKLTYNTKVEITQGKKLDYVIYVLNDGSAGSGPMKFTIKLTPNGNFENYVKAKLISNPSFTLQEGEEAKIVIQAAATASAPLATEASYQILVTCSNCQQEYATGAFIIDVQKSRGFFG